jgi:hypothetical protein
MTVENFVQFATGVSGVTTTVPPPVPPVPLDPPVGLDPAAPPKPSGSEPGEQETAMVAKNKNDAFNPNPATLVVRS